MSDNFDLNIGELLELCAIPGVSGDEDEVRELIASRCDGFADSTKTDVLGNLLVYKRGQSSENTVMVCAHMDEIGFIVKKITDDGYLKFAPVGGVDPRVLIGRRLLCGPGRINGVIGVKAVHLTKPEERKRAIKIEDMYIDIGAKNRDVAARHINLGDYCSFFTEGIVMGEGMVLAKALDDRVGCAIMLKLICECPQPRYDTVFAFTAQEEVGTRGSATAAFSVMPDECLVIEGTTAADTPPSKEQTQVCRLNGGPVFPYMDKSFIADGRMFDALRRHAGALGISWQTKEVIAGGTDAGRIHLTGKGIPCAAASVPVRYIHSACSVTSISDINSLALIAREYVMKGGDQ